MADEKKKGILSRLFGAKKSGCCNLKIEEVTDEPKKEADEKSQPRQRSCCCDKGSTGKTKSGL